MKDKKTSSKNFNNSRSNKIHGGIRRSCYQETIKNLLHHVVWAKEFIDMDNFSVGQLDANLKTWLQES